MAFDNYVTRNIISINENTPASPHTGTTANTLVYNKQIAIAGNKIIRPVGGGSSFGIIPAGLNQLIQAVYTVPLAKRYFITNWSVGAGNAAGGRYCEFTLRATAHDDEGAIEYIAGVFHVWGLIAAQDANIQQFFTLPIKLPAKTDIKISAVSDAGTASAVCSGCIEGWIENE